MWVIEMKAVGGNLMGVYAGIEKGKLNRAMPFIAAIKLEDKASAIQFTEYAARSYPCNFLNGTFDIVEHFEIEM